MRFTRLITVLALLGFSLACGSGSEQPAAPAAPVAAPAAPAAPAVTGTDPEDSIDYGEGEGSEPMDDSDPFTHYVNSSYGYCDAKVLGALWGEDTYTAKSSIGRMLMNNEDAALADKLTGCRQRALESLENREIRCHYDEIGVSYDDAVALAGFWGIDSWEAKMRVEEKYLRDAHDDTYVREAIRLARENEVGD